jgi:hypothetical protein
MSLRSRLAVASARGFALCALLVTASTVWAAPQPALKRYPPGALKLLPVPATACGQGLVYDDGSFESHPSVAGPTGLDTVMAFDLPDVPSDLSRVCVCWTRTGGTGNADFDLLVYDDDGFATQPGTLIAGLGGLRAENVPLFPEVAFYRLDLAALGVSLASPRVFIGPSWDPEAQPDLHACGDDDGGGSTLQPLFYSTDLGASWNDLGGLVPDL